MPKTQRKKSQTHRNSELLVGAIDIGGTKIATGLVSRSGRVLFRSRVRVRTEGGRPFWTR